MEKDFETVFLLDTYTKLLTEKQQRLCDMYYNQDFSLAEIAEIENTTRQAARDGISKAKQKLLHFERCLEMCDKRSKTLAAVAIAAQGTNKDIKSVIKEIEEIWER